MVRPWWGTFCGSSPLWDGEGLEPAAAKPALENRDKFTAVGYRLDASEGDFVRWET